MSARRIGTFLETVFQGFHKKRQQTLAVLVTAPGSVGKVGVASLGRAIRSRVAFQHKIQQVDRLILMVACAYFLVCLIGHPIERKGLDRLYKANTVRTRTHSAFQMGWKGHALVRWLPLVWLRHFASLVFDLDFTEPIAPTGGAARNPSRHVEMCPITLRRHSETSNDPKTV